MSSQNFPLALVNGATVPFDEARISLAHPVFLTSFGVYESIQIDNGVPFCLPDHLHRLENSAAQLSITLPSFPTLLQWGHKIIKALPSVSYALQILAIGPHGGESPLIAFIPKEITRYAPILYENGAAAITFSGKRILPQCKSFNTLINHLARAEARRTDTLEAILVADGLLYEGARSNVFAVLPDGRLVTPPAEKTLSGITKDVVIKTMAESPTPVVEMDIPQRAPISELFITSTSMHIMPITVLDGQLVGSGRVGEITRDVSTRFEQFFQNAMRKSWDILE